MSEKKYPTPHIDAEPCDFGKTVLMPGDPLRAKFIAENFLENARLVNNVRGINGFTGLYKGTKISVMASGMGMPSIGIYSYELFNFFDVDNIIRAGSAGSMQKNIHVRDIVLAMGACTNSSYGKQFGFNGSYAPICSFDLLKAAVGIAEANKLKYHVGNFLSSDTFYSDDTQSSEAFAKMGVMAVEMETAALYMNAARAGKRALGICTISDSLVSGEKTSAEERQNSFTDMMTLALETAVKI